MAAHVPGYADTESLRSASLRLSGQMRRATYILLSGAAIVLVTMYGVADARLMEPGADPLLFALLVLGVGGIVALGVLVFGRQIEELEDTLKAVRHHQDELTLTLERRAARLETHTRELEQTIEDLERFSYAASHDLREPLRMISSYLQLIERRYADEVGEEGREFIGFAVEGAQRMHELIGGLLAYANVGRAPVSFEPVDLEDVLDSALANLSLRLKEEGATIERTPLPTISGDQAQLVQLFQNLLSNAVKFHGDDPPRISISAKRARDGYWDVSVSDEGLGFDAESERRLFDIFQRAHGDRFEGSGIGLAISKRIVDRHGGTIQAISKPDEGATFRFTLPEPGAEPEHKPLQRPVSLSDRTQELI